MTDPHLIEQYLPEEVQEQAKLFDIPEKYLIEDPELIVMVLQSRSIDTTEEKQNRFNLLPLMNAEQLDKLRAILVKEKTKLKEIEEKYSKKKQDIKDKYLKKREDDGYIKKVEAIKEKEQIVASQDEEDAEDLLDMI